MRKNRSATVGGNDATDSGKRGVRSLVYNREIHDKNNPITAETSTCIEIRQGEEYFIFTRLSAEEMSVSWG